jgi:hypothetical protein
MHLLKPRLKSGLSSSLLLNVLQSPGNSSSLQLDLDLLNLQPFKLELELQPLQPPQHLLRLQVVNHVAF